MSMSLVLKKYLLFLPWTVALIATLGSLFFSEILKYPPCVLCWYQRICMYPLILILGVGIIKKDKFITSYALPLSLIGTLFAFYHNLLYYNIITEALAPCSTGVSCTTKYLTIFGFITIPILSLLAFLTINISLIIYNRLIKNNQP